MGAVRFFAGRDEVTRARQAFDNAGYTLAAVTQRVGPNVFAHLSAGEVEPLLYATRDGDRLDVLARLFLIGEPVSVDAVRPALAPLSPEQWSAGGLVAIDGDRVRGQIVIRPLGDPANRLVAHDRPRRTGAVATDHVLGVSASTAALAGVTIRRPIDAAFDLGTGCGVQAVHAAVHSRRVVASDLNRRAVALATLTVELNGLDHVSVRLGDRFDPVSGEQFDLIVSNPPYVISPLRRYMFRDSGLPVDDLCHSIVQAAPAHLNIGGHCQLLASWAHVAGEDWRQRLESWFVDTGCDSYVLEREALDPAAHAASWLRQTEQAGAWHDDFDAWMAYSEANRIEAIGFGVITMRKRDGGTPWLRVEEASQDFVMPCGDYLGAVFELADFLADADDERLLASVLAVAPDVVLDERRRHHPDGWMVIERQLRQTAGLCHSGDVDPGVVAIVTGCDGRRMLEDVLTEVAGEEELEVAEVRAAAVPIVRRLVEQGFLLPALA